MNDPRHGRGFLLPTNPVSYITAPLETGHYLSH